ncbi:hypothetical protein PoB_005572200, partial [Plakobranchus ocellatus]
MKREATKNHTNHSAMDDRLCLFPRFDPAFHTYVLSLKPWDSRISQVCDGSFTSQSVFMHQFLAEVTKKISKSTFNFVCFAWPCYLIRNIISLLLL